MTDPRSVPYTWITISLRENLLNIEKFDGVIRVFCTATVTVVEIFPTKGNHRQI